MSFLLFAAAQAAIIAGQPILCTAPWHYDGDDIRCTDPAWRALAHGHGMRLHAIDAPELSCAGRRGKRCTTQGGVAARDRLRALTRGRRVMCVWTGDRTGVHTGNRPVVECAADGVGDLGCAMLRAGVVRYEPRYDADGRYARRCKANR